MFHTHTHLNNRKNNGGRLIFGKNTCISETRNVNEHFIMKSKSVIGMWSYMTRVTSLLLWFLGDTIKSWEWDLVNLLRLLKQDAAESSLCHLGFFDPLFWMRHSVCDGRSVLWRTETSLSVGQQLVFCKSCLLWENMCDHWQPLKVQLDQYDWDCCGICYALIKRRAHPNVRSLRTAGDGHLKGKTCCMKSGAENNINGTMWKIVRLSFDRETNQPSLWLCSSALP